MLKKGEEEEEEEEKKIKRPRRQATDWKKIFLKDKELTSKMVKNSFFFLFNLKTFPIGEPNDSQTLNAQVFQPYGGEAKGICAWFPLPS